VKVTCRRIWNQYPINLDLIDLADAEWDFTLKREAEEKKKKKVVDNTPDPDWYIGRGGMKFFEPAVLAIQKDIRGCVKRWKEGLETIDDLNYAASNSVDTIFGYYRKPKLEGGAGVNLAIHPYYKKGTKSFAAEIYAAEAIEREVQRRAAIFMAVQPDLSFVQNSKFGNFNDQKRREEFENQYCEQYGIVTRCATKIVNVFRDPDNKLPECKYPSSTRDFNFDPNQPLRYTQPVQPTIFNSNSNGYVRIVEAIQGRHALIPSYNPFH
jgi:hypothetical protein